MGFVNGTRGYIDTVGTRPTGKVINPTKHGGLVAFYYFGVMAGCFVGGRFGNNSGRKAAVILRS